MSLKKGRNPAFGKGLTDFNKGRLGNNPHDPYEDFDDYREYELGFKKGYFDNLEKVKKREQSGRRGEKVYGRQKEIRQAKPSG